MGLVDQALRFLGFRRGDQTTLSARELDETLSALAAPEKVRTDAYALYGAYYDGHQGVKLNERTKAFLQLHGLPWSENFCESVVDILAERLRVEAIAHKAAEEDRNEALQEWLTAYWQGDEAGELQSTVHTQTPMKGDGFVAVDWDAETGRPAMYWNDPSTCTPIYDVNGRLVMVAKSWNESGVSPTNPHGMLIRRLNLYYPDRIEKWFTLSNDGKSLWSMHMDAGDPGWPIAWVRSDGRPRGIAIVHFRHKPLGGDFGRSCLKSAVPQQNYLNKQLVDLAMIMDSQAWRQRWGTGISSDAAKALKNQPGELWASSNSAAKFGSFDAEDPTGPLAAIEATLQRFAARNKRPLHLLLTTGALPSGESLRVAEAPLIHDANDCHSPYGRSWVTAAGLMAGLEADYGSAGITYTDEVLEAAWQDPATRNEQTEAETAEILQRVGVSQQTTLERLGFDPAREADYRREERREREAEFDRGEGGEGGSPAGGEGGEGGGGEGGGE